MKIYNFEQGSEEWHRVRLEKISGTRFKDLMGTTEKYYKLIAELIAEKRTERSKVFKTTAEMERGSAEEPYAVKRFTELTGKKVDSVGFTVSEEFSRAGNSPDGLIKDSKGKYTEAIEIKSLNSENQVFYEMLNEFPEINEKMTKAKKLEIGIPREYEWQVVSYFLVNPDLETLYFLLWDSRVLDEGKQLNITEVKRENEILQEKIKEAKEKLVEFEKDYKKIEEVLLKSDF